MKIIPRILVVDDEPQIRRVFKISLTARGYNARMAAEIFSYRLPDLIVTDLSMPGMNGLQLCRNLRAKLRIPIIVLSTERKEHAKIEAFDACVDDYQTKPFQINGSFARIRALLSANKENKTIST